MATFNVLDYGAVGDGVTNDTDAFSAASAALEAADGGHLVIPEGVYIVGKQVLTGATGQSWAYRPSGLISIDGCAGSVTISGYGAILKCAAGLRYGQFDPVTGNASTGQPNNVDYRATPYGHMINVRNCTGPVAIEGLELDGNIPALVIGGPYGDTGRQIHAYGVYLYQNTGGVRVSDVISRYHALDSSAVEHSGLVENSPTYSVLFENCDFSGSGRQGLSWVGGNKFTAINCKFNNTGKTVNTGLNAALVSSPAAGVDLEAEGSIVRNGHFINCDFTNNAGCGMVADSGDVARAVFENCRFIGTTSPPLWVRKPYFTFKNCLILGQVNAVHGSTMRLVATRFIRCEFTVTSAYSPTNSTYLPHSYLVDSGGGDTNVLYDECHFGSYNSPFMWTTDGGPIIRNCQFEGSGGSTPTSYVRGIFEGYNTINGSGTIDFGSTLRKRGGGQVILNGVPQ